MTEAERSVETTVEARCPVCGKACKLTVVHSLTGEAVSAAAHCPECGTTPVVYGILPTGDRRLTLSDGSVYEPSMKVYSLREAARGLTGSEGLRTRLKVAEALRDDEREREAVSECLTIEEEAFATDPLTPEVRDIGISAAFTAGRIMDWNGDSDAAAKIYGGALEHAEQSDSEDAAALRVEYVFDTSVGKPDGDAAIRAMADEIEKSGGRAYRGSIPAAVNVYDAMTSFYAMKGKMKQAFAAARKAAGCAEAAMAASPSEERTADLLHCLHVCSQTAYSAGNPGKGREYAKKLLRTSESLKDTDPKQYGDGILMFARIAADSDPDLIPESRKRMEELIDFLPKKEESGLPDERVALAYFYHSLRKGDGELDPDDLEHAYAILRDNAFCERAARDIFMMVGTTYLVYLQDRDRARADAVRDEMRSMGLFRSLSEEGYGPKDTGSGPADGNGDAGPDQTRK